MLAGAGVGTIEAPSPLCRVDALPPGLSARGRSSPPAPKFAHGAPEKQALRHCLKLAFRTSHVFIARTNEIFSYCSRAAEMFANLESCCDARVAAGQLSRLQNGDRVGDARVAAGPRRRFQNWNRVGNIRV